MGACCCAPRTEEDIASRKVDTQLRKDRMQNTDEMKLLLLGAGESGKSTIFKQMKIIHQNGYSAEELSSFVPVVHSNVVQCLKILLDALGAVDGPKLPQDLHQAKSKVEGLQLNARLGPDWVAPLTALWRSDAIAHVYARAAEIQLPDSAAYFLDDLERICGADYQPTEQDVLHTRVRTTGIVEMSWVLDQVPFRMFDVGGQRNERRKWIHCFDNVTAVIFVASLSEYDQALYEDRNQNRLHEALSLFDQICNSRWFLNTAMILFLNKTDLFRKKIEAGVDLRACFPDYNGPLAEPEMGKFIEQQFRRLNRQGQRPVYVHMTCATDTKNIRFVFSAVKDIVLQRNLKESGF